MKLIDDDIPQLLQSSGPLVPMTEELGLQRLRRNQQHAALFARSSFDAAAYVAVPPKHRNVHRRQKLIETLILVVNQRLEGTDVQSTDAP
jgi:hypothetical protein